MHGAQCLAALWCLALCACRKTSAAPVASAVALPASPLRTIIVSGGPSLQQNEYAIESNARYVEGLTRAASWRRIHFADGRKTSRTIGSTAAVERERVILDWLLDRSTEDAFERVASQLPRIDGASLQAPILRSVTALTQGAKPTSRGLVYFTGHGSYGVQRTLGIARADYQNTTYALWNEGELSVRELARELQKWPKGAPLVLIMVQCHSGGFANVMFEGGDPTQPIWDADFAGFFAATAERPSAGCTAEMDERDYQDFTTHFFAALSGRTRDGQTLRGADYDRNGAVSMSEAYAWAALRDLSIDVPVSTSDAYLRHLYGNTGGDEWMKTPYSALRLSAAPWQRAMLDGLSRALKLSGEKRVATAMSKVRKPNPQSSGDWWLEARFARESRRFTALDERLTRRYPRLRTSEKQQKAALLWLRSQPKDVDLLHRLYQTLLHENAEVSAAMQLRFVRAARTVELQKRLAREGTAEQQKIFARLRTAEGRNPLR